MPLLHSVTKLAGAALIMGLGSAFAAEDCTLFVDEPVITHATYGVNNRSNEVNSGVLRVLQGNGFTISTRANNARYTMETNVRCASMRTLFGVYDYCQTEVRFYDNVESKLAYSYGPTRAMPGLNIDFNSVQFPVCENL